MTLAKAHKSICILLVFLMTVTKSIDGRHVGRFGISGSTGHRIRHHGRHSPQATLQTSNTTEQTNALAGVQSHILSALGMSETPKVGRVELPDHMRAVLQDEISLEREEEEKHFMADSANVLLTASKVINEEYGETMQFTLTPADRQTKMLETKLYFHINPDDITMMEEKDAKPMHLQLQLLTAQSNGSITSRTIEEKILIHSHLVGWHNHELQSGLLRRAIRSGGNTDSDITLVLKLVCLNCHYRVFPEIITKQSVPFLTINGRRRSRRNGQRSCSGSCCLKELIVDFNALGSSWDFVIHPRRYQANYCAGSCLQPAPADRIQMTSNTHILNEMLSRQQAVATSSCCVAADQERILLAYYVDGGAVRTNNNAIKRINSCRCV